jgi:hypothetical protein
MIDDVTRGYEFLREDGPWHEVSVGNGWMNSLAETLIWNEGIVAATPTFVLRRRTVWVSPSRDVMFEYHGRSLAIAGHSQIAAIGNSPPWEQLFP